MILWYFPSWTMTTEDSVNLVSLEANVTRNLISHLQFSLKNRKPTPTASLNSFRLVKPFSLNCVTTGTCCTTLISFSAFCLHLLPHETGWEESLEVVHSSLQLNGFIISVWFAIIVNVAVSPASVCIAMKPQLCSHAPSACCLFKMY